MEKTFYWYDVTVQFETVDEKTEKVKKIKELYLVKAVNSSDAIIQVEKDIEGTTMEHRIFATKESKVIRVIKPENVDLND